MRKNKSKKRVNFLLLTMITVLLVNLHVNNQSTVRAVLKTPQTIELVNNGMRNPTEPVDNLTRWSGDFVYFGADEDGIPIKFRILDTQSTDFGGNTMLLDSDEGIAQWQFNTTTVENPTIWETSEMKRWLNDDFLNNCFTSIEINSMANSIKEAKPDIEMKSFYPETIIHSTQPALTGEKLFCLSVEEVMNTKYGYSNTLNAVYSRRKYPDKRFHWRLRSGSDYSTYIATTCVGIDGSFTYGAVEDPFTYLVAPALNVELDKILFSTPANTSKPEKLTVPSDYTSGEWKLTLDDDNDFSIGTTLKSYVISNGGVIEIEHSSLASYNSGYTNLTAMITDSTGQNILYYGSVNDDINALNTNIQLPESLSDGNYKLSLYAEQWNSGTTTDYASKPLTVDIEVRDITQSSIVYQDGMQIFSHFIDGYQAPGSYVEGVGVTLPTANQIHKEGYVFKGWYQSSDFSGTPIIQIDESIKGNQTYYAKWEKVEPILTVSEIVYMDGQQKFNYFDAGYIAPMKYTEGKEIMLPVAVNIHKAGYTFMGWYDNAELLGNSIYKIDALAKGTQTFYAKWRKDAVTSTYKFIAGEDGEWIYKTNEKLIFRVDGDFSKFKEVKVDGKLLSQEHYMAESGSTIVTLKPEYLNTLSLGEHTIEIVFDDQIVSTSFRIKANSPVINDDIADKENIVNKENIADTSDALNREQYIGLIVLSFLSFVAVRKCQRINKKS